MTYKNRAEVTNKVDWEGGISGALEYGLTVDDMPPGDTELRDAWKRLEAAWKAFDAIETEVYALLDEDGEADG